MDNQFSKELVFLLQVINEDECDFPAEPFDWKEFIQLAIHHRIYPSFCARLGNGKILPPEVVQSLDQLFRYNTFHMLKLAAEMKNIHDVFEGEGIRCLQLKGPTLGAELYGDLSLRASGDLDMLIDLHDLPQAEQSLMNLGYVKEDYIESVLNDWKWRHHHFTYFHPNQKTKVELHWRLNPGPSKEPAFEQLWQRRRVSTFMSMPVLSWEDLFFFLVSHGSRHGWSRLRWLHDIRQLTKHNLNWEQIISLQRKYQQLHVGGQALLLASQLFQQPLHDVMKPLVSGRRPSQLAEEALFYMRQRVNLHNEPVPENIAQYHKQHLFALKSFRQRLWFILSMFYPYAKDARTLPLPKKLHFLYFPLRPLLMLWRKTQKQAYD